MPTPTTPPATRAGKVAHEDDDLNREQFVPYLPHDLEYGASFENALMDLVLNWDGRPRQEGIRVILDGSTETPVEGSSVRARDIAVKDLPVVRQEELPLRLDDPRRIYASPIPGVRLTHPGGYLEGGPGLDPEMDTFPDDFFSNNPSIQHSEELEIAKQKEIDHQVEQLKARLYARKTAVEKNQRISKELQYLMDQRETELKVQQRVADEIKARREAKARRLNQKNDT